MPEIMNENASFVLSARCAMESELSISVIVPVRNEGRHIESTLRQLLAQQYDFDQFEILVVDGDSTDDTVERVKTIAAEHPQVRLLHNPRRLSSTARNVGIRNARGAIVMIVDGHCELGSPLILKNVAAAFRRSGADCLGRPQPLDIVGATPMQQAISLARSSRLGHHPRSFIYSDRERFVPAHSVAVAYRREVFEKVGYFDERFDACEDVELNHRVDRAGLKCFFTSAIQVRYHPRTSLGGLFSQIVRYGRGRMRLLRKHPETFSLGSLLPALFFLGVLLGWTGGFIWSWLWIAYLGVLGLYSGTLFMESTMIAFTQNKFRLWPLLPLVLATVHLASATGVIGELMAGNRAKPLGPRSSRGKSILRRSGDSEVQTNVERNTGTQDVGPSAKAVPAPERGNGTVSFKPRILLVAASEHTTAGRSVMAQRLIADLRGEGYQVGFVPLEPRPPEMPHFWNFLKYMQKLVRMFFYIIALIRQVPKYDMVHIFSASSGSLLVSTAPAILIARMFRKTAILDYHSAEAEDHLMSSGRISRWVLKLPTRIVVPSPYLAADSENCACRAVAAKWISLYRELNQAPGSTLPLESHVATQPSEHHACGV
jgi:succinoglycan biosynthesis protein ExoA